MIIKAHVNVHIYLYTCVLIISMILKPRLKKPEKCMAPLLLGHERKSLHLYLFQSSILLHHVLSDPSLEMTVLGECGERLGKGAWHGLHDAVGCQLLVAHVLWKQPGVFPGQLAGPVDTIGSRGDDGGQEQVHVGRGIGKSQLPAAALDGADRKVTVLGAPADPEPCAIGNDSGIAVKVGHAECAQGGEPVKNAGEEGVCVGHGRAEGYMDVGAVLGA